MGKPVREAMPETYRQTRRVQQHETDATGVMQMAHYLRYMEDCEHEFIHSLGYAMDYAEGGITHGWPRVDVRCEIREALRPGEEVTVELRVISLSSKSIGYGFLFYREGGSEPAARGYIRPVHVRMSGGGIEPAPMPDSLASQLTVMDDAERAPFSDWLS